MAEHPILFSGPMVRAILEGRKTQTRRVIKDGPQGDFWGKPQTSGYPGDPWYVTANLSPASTHTFKPCPYGKRGERLWVRETWASHFNQRFHDEHGLSAPDFLVDSVTREPLIVYAADRQFPMLINDEFMAEHEHIAWKPSIHMRRTASRLTLETANVRVERLQEISEADAIAEGLTQWSDPPRVTSVHYGESRADVWETDPRKAYARLWDTINAKRGYSWESNPWVWVVEFRKLA